MQNGTVAFLIMFIVYLIIILIYCCIPPTILHRHNSKESTVHLCHTRTLSDNPNRLTRPA
jgi:ABC-type transport system involved in multi-copper enzyme maturation permease subunit